MVSKKKTPKDLFETKASQRKGPNPHAVSLNAAIRHRIAARRGGATRPLPRKQKGYQDVSSRE